ncbi:hypothetical protein ACQP0C_31005 [Nocardia sp. CA-129566]|uniref:hypothetical protein n=1 Tax=Nocardia sp. CA-129566 TaxID=3239976 RepID=UPI003D98B7D6
MAIEIPSEVAFFLNICGALADRFGDRVGPVAVGSGTLSDGTGGRPRGVGFVAALADWLHEMIEGAPADLGGTELAAAHCPAHRAAALTCGRRYRPIGGLSGGMRLSVELGGFTLASRNPLKQSRFSARCPSQQREQA